MLWFPASPSQRKEKAICHRILRGCKILRFLIYFDPVLVILPGHPTPMIEPCFFNSAYNVAPYGFSIISEILNSPHRNFVKGNTRKNYPFRRRLLSAQKQRSSISMCKLISRVFTRRGFLALYHWKAAVVIQRIYRRFVIRMRLLSVRKHLSSINMCELINRVKHVVIFVPCSLESPLHSMKCKRH
jgi:hypothetical protein